MSIIYMSIYIIACQCNLTVITTVSSDIYCLKRNLVWEWQSIYIPIPDKFFAYVFKHLLTNVKVSQNIKKHLMNPEIQHRYKICYTFHVRTNHMCSTTEPSMVKNMHYYGKESVIYAFASGQTNCLNNADYKADLLFFLKIMKTPHK